jgi:DNA integrity scanning protein DisA with diadenylate cyclase activity
MRHRTAECVAREIQGAVVIAISKRNDTITLFLAGEKYVLLDKVRLLAESLHAIDMAEFYGRGYFDATRDLLASPAAEAIGHDFDLVSQWREKLLRTICSIRCHHAELGTDGDIIHARLTKVAEAANVALAPLLQQIGREILRDRQTT